MRSLSKVALATTLVAGSFFPFLLSAEDKKPISKAEFLNAYGGPDSHKAGVAIDRLDPDGKEGYELLKKVLGDKGSQWYYRVKAASVLSKTGNEANLKDMIACLQEKTEKNAMVRQGMVIALAKMKDPKYLPDIQKTLGDKDRRVRRECAWRLREGVRETSSITALIDHWKEEKDSTVNNFIRQTLEDLTQQFLGPKFEAWEAWWSEHKDTFKLAATDEEQQKLNEEAAKSEAAKKAEEDGKKLSAGTTRSKDVDLSFQARGKGTPVLVLPEYGISTKIMIPFFFELEKQAKVCYMNLPKVASFKNLPPPKDASGNPDYPLDQLVGAFDDFRKAQKVDKFVIVACGMNSWIAMRYATKFPKNVAALVFVSPCSSSDGYGKALDRMVHQSDGVMTGDVELYHFSLTQRHNSQTGESSHDIWHKDKKVDKPAGEDEAIERKRFTIYFGEPVDTIIDQLIGEHLDWPGNVGIPNFKAETETPGPPTLVLAGKRSWWTSEDDVGRVAKQYGAQVVMFDNSADFPFIDEPERFTEAVRKFVTKYVAQPKSDKGGDKK